MPLNILIGTNALPPQVGGLENLTNDLALYLQQVGNAVTVVASSNYGHLQPIRNYTTITLDSFLLARLPVPKLTRKNLGYLRGLLKNKYDVSILQSHLFVSNWILAVALRRKTKLAWINYGGSVVSHNSKLIYLLIRIYEYIGVKIMMFCCDYRLTQSERSLRRFSNERSELNIINNCVPDDLLNSSLSRGEIGNINKILFVGRFVEDKGILQLLERVRAAIDSMKEKDSVAKESLTLTLIGDGPLREKVISFLDTHLNINWVVQELPDRHSVVNEMLNHDLLIQFPKSEGQPGVTLEALSVGLPIFTTPIDKCLEEMEGVFVCEEQEFADKLCSILMNTKKIKINVERNREHLRNHHSVKSTVSRIFEVI